jgi:phospholipid/cholesterol/gamma-HCH transport system substrate-binding protein
MTPSPIRDLLVGIFLIAGFAALGYLSVELGGLSYTGPGGMTLVATFDEIGGLRPRSLVVVGGVKVGQVEKVELDPEFRARVTLSVDASLQLPDDSSASIRTSGVLGDQYLALTPGASETLLAPGGQIPYTESAIVLERMVGKLVDSLASEKPK